MPTTIDELLTLADESIRFPHSAMQIAQLAQRPDATNSDLASLIEQDPAFSVQLLRIVNSASYSPVSPIVSLTDAISRVGREAIVELAWLQSSANAFDHLESEFLRATTFWAHCRATAVLAAKIAESVGQAAGDAFVSGLLHDIGLLLLFHTQPRRIGEVLDHSLDQHVGLCVSERLILGFDHAELGAALAEHWSLPDVLTCAIRHHHEPAAAPRHRELVACVALANQIDDESSQDEDVVQDAQALLTTDTLALTTLLEQSAEKSERYSTIVL